MTATPRGDGGGERWQPASEHPDHPLAAINGASLGGGLRLVVLLGPRSSVGSTYFRCMLDGPGGATSAPVIFGLQNSGPFPGFNWIEVPAGDLTAQVSRLRATYTISPRSFLGALVQYNSAAQLFSANVRYRWEYSPGSDLFVVFSTNRDETDGLSGLSDRTLVVKLTRLFRF